MTFQLSKKDLSFSAIMSLFLALFLTVGSIPHAEATTRAQVTAGGQEMAEMTPSELEGFISTHDFEVEPDSGLPYDPSSATGWYVNDSDVYIAYDLIGGGELQLGTVGVMFDSQGGQTQTEIVAIGNQAEGHSRIWNDHELILDQHFNPVKDDGMMTAQWGFYDRFTDCMSNEGVPGWVVNTISIGCALVCAATVGTGCAVCVAGLAGVYSGQISYCFGETA